MKRGLVFGIIFGLLIGIFLINLVCASFILAPGNNSHSIQVSYSSGEKITGWINISFQNESANSSLNAFDSKISLLDFLLNSSADFDSIPQDYSSSYTLSSGELSKSFSMTPTNRKLFGFRIQGEEIVITDFSFDFQSDASPSCTSQLNLDLLKDRAYNWKSNSFLSDSFCNIEDSMACFDDTEGELVGITSSVPFCQKIEFPPRAKFKVGAGIYNNTAANPSVQFKFDAYASESGQESSCTINSIAGEDFQEISCLVDGLNLKQLEDVYVCISTVNSVDDEKYSTLYENNDPCGFEGNPGDFNGMFKYDFYIFAESAKYEELDSASFNDATLKTINEDAEDLKYYIQDYLSNKYNSDCSNECAIPLEVYSLSNQQLAISNINLKYTSSSRPGTITETKIYDAKEIPAKINMGFQKLDLGKANLLVPFEKGDYDFILTLDGAEILDEGIDVLDGGAIIGIFPNDVPAFVSKRFYLILNSEINDSRYSWNFGDGTKITTDIKSAEHTYSKIGVYNLSVTVSNKFGNSSKTIEVNVGSPKNYINSTIIDYNSKLDKMKIEINKLPQWIQTEIKKQFDVDSLKSLVKSQESKYDAAFSDDDYVKIMQALVELNIPDSFNVSQKVDSSVFIPNPEELNLAALDYFGAGSVDGTEEAYANAVTNWFMKAVDGKIESKTYSLYYPDEIEELLTYVKVTLIPKDDQNLDVVYFLVNGNPDEVKINTDKTIKEYDDASGVIFSELTSQEIIEFLYSEKLLIGKFPVYVSPEFRNLELEVEPGICNFNKKCEKDLKENYKNCRSDCKPVGLTILWILILLFIALVVYIILQEWYKRHYESHLFPDRNQLFNLINFMSISYNQGMRKSDVFSKLKNLNWESEQLDYAWNKFLGKRTGMWEIPIFKWVENKQVKRELEKRGNLNRNNYPPRF